MNKLSHSVGLLVLLVAGWAPCALEAELPKLISDGFKRSEAICRDVENIRGLKFKEKVKTQVQSKEDLRKFIRKQMEKQYGREDAAWYVRALVKVGVLEKELDLTETMIKLLEGQAAAHYDPESRNCYLLITDMDPMMLDVVLSHELCHALQDQNFNLLDFCITDTTAMKDNGDATLGKECLVEGDATYVMTAWMLAKVAGIHEAAVADSMVSMAINAQGAMDYDTIMTMASGTNDLAFGAFNTAMKDMKDLPRFFMESIYYTYIQGSLMVNYVKAKGGWRAVDRLYKNPPQSTEQVLHPDKLDGKRDVPVDVRLPDLKTIFPDKWEIKEDDVLGELGVRILFELWSAKEDRDPAAISAAAAGWGGDRYYLLVNNETGKDLLVWKTVWDTVQDAGEFTTAYRIMLSSRFPKMKKAGQSAVGGKFVFQIWEVEPGRFIKLVSDGAMVGIIDSTDRSCLDRMWK